MLIGPLKLKAQVYCGDQLAMGPGKADVLEAIDREGSISAAARTLGMSYRRAWILVDTMNRCWREPLVETRSGGGNERGAVVTGAGRAALIAYRTLEAVMAAASCEAMGALMENLRTEPRPPDRGPTRPA